MKTISKGDSEKLALELAETMLRNDRVSQHLGIRLEEVTAGSATTSMIVREDMLNGLGICHGGIIFTFADTAFALACNSRNRRTVALTCTINFIASPEVGETLTARAREISLGGRTGIYDIEIVDSSGKPISQFRGTSYGTRSTVL